MKLFRSCGFVALSVVTATIFALGIRPAAAQEVEIISGTTAAPAEAAAVPGVRVIRFLAPDGSAVEHRVAAPLQPLEILHVQEALAMVGLDPGPRDGMMGPSTRAALSGFQRERALEPCGCIDYATVTGLGLRPLVFQTVIGSPAGESDAEIVVGNRRLPTPQASPPAAETPPETVTVVRETGAGWWSFPGFFHTIVPTGPAPAAAAPRGGVPFGPAIRLGPPARVPPPRR